MTDLIRCADYGTITAVYVHDVGYCNRTTVHFLVLVFIVAYTVRRERVSQLQPIRASTNNQASYLMLSLHRMTIHSDLIGSTSFMQATLTTTTRDFILKLQIWVYVGNVGSTASRELASRSDRISCAWQ